MLFLLSLCILKYLQFEPWIFKIGKKFFNDIFQQLPLSINVVFSAQYCFKFNIFPFMHKNVVILSELSMRRSSKKKEIRGIEAVWFATLLGKKWKVTKTKFFVTLLLTTCSIFHYLKYFYVPKVIWNFFGTDFITYKKSIIP